VFSHQSPGASPGDGTIAASITTGSTGTRSHTSGAVKPGQRLCDLGNCRCGLRSRQPPRRRTRDKRPSPSSQSKSGATTSCPKARSTGVTRCQYQESRGGTVDQDIRGHCVLPTATYRAPWRFSGRHALLAFLFYCITSLPGHHAHRTFGIRLPALAERCVFGFKHGEGRPAGRTRRLSGRERISTARGRQAGS
jgi:hypothetical protein